MPKPATLAALLLGVLIMTLKILFLLRKNGRPHDDSNS
jgi:hypothetical protein